MAPSRLVNGPTEYLYEIAYVGTMYDLGICLPFFAVYRYVVAVKEIKKHTMPQQTIHGIHLCRHGEECVSKSVNNVHQVIT